MDTLDLLQLDKKDLEEKITREKERKQYEHIAEQLRTLYDSLLDNGFSETQAWQLVVMIVKKSLDAR